MAARPFDDLGAGSLPAWMPSFQEEIDKEIDSNRKRMITGANEGNGAEEKKVGTNFCR
jgi:hypothetical protein